MPAVVALDDDQAAAGPAVGRLEEVAPHERRAQEHEILEVDLDVGEELAHVFVDRAQSLTGAEPVGTPWRWAALWANEIVEHEKRGERGSLEPTIWAGDETLDPPGGGASVTGFGRDDQTSPQCGKAASGDAGESRDHVGTDLEAQKTSRERKGAHLAIDGILGGR